MARTPPAMRICGARNVIFTNVPPSPYPLPPGRERGERGSLSPGGRGIYGGFAASNGHGDLAAATVGGRVEDDVDARHVGRSHGLLERGAQLLGLRHLHTFAPERLHHPVEAREGQRCRHLAFGAEEGQLRVADLPPAAVVADDDRHRELEAHGRLHLHAVQPEGAVAGDQQDPLGGAQPPTPPPSPTTVVCASTTAAISWPSR